MVLLVIGDVKTTILRAVLVEFDQEIMIAYQSCLARCNDHSLKWAYETNDYAFVLDLGSE